MSEPPKVTDSFSGEFSRKFSFNVIQTIDELISMKINGFLSFNVEFLKQSYLEQTEQPIETDIGSKHD